MAAPVLSPSNSEATAGAQALVCLLSGTRQQLHTDQQQQNTAASVPDMATAAKARATATAATAAAAAAAAARPAASSAQFRRKPAQPAEASSASAPPRDRHTSTSKKKVKRKRPETESPSAAPGPPALREGGGSGPGLDGGGSRDRPGSAAAAARAVRPPCPAGFNMFAAAASTSALALAPGADTGPTNPPEPAAEAGPPDFFSRLSSTLPVNNSDWQCGARCVAMRDSSHLLRSGQSAALWERLNREGYLLLRGVLPAQDPTIARQLVLAQLDKLGACRRTCTVDADASTGQECSANIATTKDFTNHTRQKAKHGRGSETAPAPAAGSAAAAQTAAGHSASDESSIRGGGSSGSGSGSGSGSSSSLRLLRHGWLVDLWDGVVEPASASVAPDREWPDVQQHPLIRGLPCHKSLMSMYRTIFRLSGLYWRALPLDERSSWLRAKADGESTRPHSDYGYFRRYRAILSRYYCERPLTVKQTQDQSLHDVVGLDSFQRRMRCVWRCPFYGASQKSNEPPRFLCSLCKVGYHASCLAGLGAAAPSAAECEDQKQSRGEWHCPTCSEANMDMWTCWMPLGNIPADPSHSRLMLLPGSHLLQGYNAILQGDKTKASTSRAADAAAAGTAAAAAAAAAAAPALPAAASHAPRARSHRRSSGGNDTVAQEETLLPRSWTGPLRTQAVWHTAEQLQAGDIILFNIKLIHAANPNTSGQFRISLDTRVIATSAWLNEDPAA